MATPIKQKQVNIQLHMEPKFHKPLQLKVFSPHIYDLSVPSIEVRLRSLPV